MMGCRQFMVPSFVLACVSLSDAWLYGSGVLTHWGAGGQKPAAAEVKAETWSVQRADRLQKTRAEAVLPSFSWKFPEHPVNLVRDLPIEFRPQQSVKSNRLAVRCGENQVFVEVSQDLLGLGRLVKPEELTLGGCPASEVDTVAHVLVFESDLHGCGSKLVMTDKVFLYAFELLYNPAVSGRGLITRSRSAVIGIECHYKRKSSVSTGPLKEPHNDIQEYPNFSLKLKSGDWTVERSSSKFTLADTINLEASVVPSGDLPLKVLVDRCAAARHPGLSSEPKQDFIKNHGCLGSRASPSSFLPQPRPDTLHFQVEASSFHPLRMLFISCYLKAMPTSEPTTIEHKSCSFTEGQWRAVDGKHGFCACCASTCGMRKARALASGEKDVKWDAELIVGPLIIQ